MDAAPLVGLEQDRAASCPSAKAVNAAVFDDGGEVVRGPLLYSFRERQPYLRRLACEFEPLVLAHINSRSPGAAFGQRPSRAKRYTFSLRSTIEKKR